MLCMGSTAKATGTDLNGSNENHMQCLTAICAWSAPFNPLPWPLITKVTESELWLTAFKCYHMYHASLLNRWPGNDHSTSGKKFKTK